MQNPTNGLRALIAVALVGGAGCGARGDLASLNVKSASLENMTLETAAAIVGVNTGGGDLVVEDTDGESHVFTATLGGPAFGVLLDASANDEHQFDLDGFGAEMDISGAGKEPTGAVLLGVYGGSGASMHLAFGVSGADLENQSGVKLTFSLLGVGIGFFAGYEWLTLDLDDDEEK